MDGETPLRYIPILLFIFGCNSLRKIDVCMVQGEVAECANGDDKYKLQYPTQMLGWHCWDLEAQMLLGESLQTCEADGKLPRDDQTWYRMGVCEIYKDNFVKMPCGDVNGFICTNPEGAQKIESKLTYCTHH